MGDKSEPPDARARHQFERLVFFSDAVFAIAITVLVLDLKAPIGPHGELRLEKAMPDIVGFVLSFYVIGIYWQAHHTLFGRLEREDRLLRQVNLLFLLTIVFMPFPTSILSKFDASPTTITLYASSVAAVGLMQTALILVARRPGIMRPEDLALGVGQLISRPLASSIVFLASIPVAFVVPRRAELFWLLLLPTRGLIGRVADRVEHRQPANTFH